MESAKSVSEDDLQAISSDSNAVHEKIIETDGVIWSRLTIERQGDYEQFNADRDTFGHLLSGDVDVSVPGEANNDLTLSDGDFFRIPAGGKCLFKNNGDDTGEMLFLTVDFTISELKSSDRVDKDVASIDVIREGQLKANTETTGIDREVAFDEEEIYFLRAEVDGGRTSDWHHHFDREVFSHIVEGTAHLEFGPEGHDKVVVNDGEYLYIPTRVIHRDLNPDDGAVQRAVAAFIGDGPLVENVDSPR